MKYIAKGLPANRGPRRFILTDKRGAAWRPYGITPIFYDLQSQEENPHISITESVSKWVADLHRGLHEKAEVIRSIVEAAPPLEGEEADYLHAALREADTAKQFRRFARLPDYIEWTEKHGHLKPLFQNEQPLTEAQSELAEWYVKHCVPHHHARALSVFQGSGSILNSVVCRLLWHALNYRKPEDGYDMVFATWVTILLTHADDHLTFNEWEQILHTCKWPQDKEVALLLLDRCFRPSLVLKKAWNIFGELDSSREEQLVDYAIDLAEKHDFFLSSVWQVYFKLRLGEFAFTLESVVTRNLEKAHILLRANRKIEGRHDPLGFYRRRIAERHDLGAGHALDALIDAAVDLMRHSVQTDSDTSNSLTAKWIRSASPILNRVSIYGVAINQTMKSDEKIDWLLQNDLILHTVGELEVLDLLKDAYSSSTSDIRQRLIDSIAKRYEAITHSLEASYFSPYDVFNLLRSISNADPTCGIAACALQTLKQRNPEVDRRRETEVDWTHGEWQNMGDDIDIEQILAQAPSKWIEEILFRQRTNGSDFELDEKVHAIMRAVTRQPAWGFEAQTYLAGEAIEEPAIWNQLFNGWREAQLNPTLWKQLFDSFESLPDWEPCADGIAEILYAGSARKENIIPNELMEQALHLSQKSFAVLQRKKNDNPVSSKNWLGLAINRPGGKLAMFWLEYLSRLKRESDAAWEGLPNPIKSLFRVIAEGRSGDSILARVILVSQLHYLHFLDRSFATEVIVPLLDWSRDPICAAQCWQGFLGWGQWKTNFIDLILPFYHQTLNHLSEFESEHLDAFAAHGNHRGIRRRKPSTGFSLPAHRSLRHSATDKIRQNDSTGS